MIRLKNIQMHYPEQTVLRDVSIQMGPRERIALIGGNGTGKSTLLRIMAGEKLPTGGAVEMQKGLTLGYLPQTGLTFRGRTLWEEMLTALPEWLEQRRKRRELLEKISSVHPEDPEHERAMVEYGEAETSYQQKDGYAQESRLKSILTGLGFSGQDLTRSVEEFSAGWQMRIGLGKVLAAAPRFMLLDEPTDHLDLDAKNWLEQYLCDGDFGFVLVSHDRHLLDALPEKIMEIENGEVSVYLGNYTKYLGEKQRREQAAEKEGALQEREVKRLETYIARNRVRKDRAQQVQSRIRRLEQMESVDRATKRADMRFWFPSPSRAPRKLVELVQVSKSYDDVSLIQGLDLVVERGERIAVVGPNGAGKSTLMRILQGGESVEQGARLAGDRVSIGWFSQDAGAGFREDESALEALLSADPLTTQEKGRALLARFGIRGDQAFQSVKTLSGGERVRLALASLLLHRHHLLLLDEPTNHLDILARQALLDALLSYNGTLVFVSHDRYFIQELATRILEIQQGRVTSLLGSYEDYLSAKEEGHRQMDVLSHVAAKGSLQEPCRSDGGSEKAERILQREKEKKRQRAAQRRDRERGRLEGEIERLEERLAAVEKEMASPGVAEDFERLHGLHQEAEGIKRELDERYAAWENLIEDDGEEIRQA